MEQQEWIWQTVKNPQNSDSINIQTQHHHTHKLTHPIRKRPVVVTGMFTKKHRTRRGKHVQHTHHGHDERVGGEEEEGALSIL
jgi:hypothetical protein